MSHQTLVQLFSYMTPKLTHRRSVLYAGAAEVFLEGLLSRSSPCREEVDIQGKMLEKCALKEQEDSVCVCV